MITNAAGCGSALREYGELFEGRAEAAAAAGFRADRWTSRCFSTSSGRPAAGLREARRVAYHDACHLAHAQRVTPRRGGCSAVEGLELVEIPEGDLLRLGRDLQHRASRDRRCAGGGEGRGHSERQTRCDRARQRGLHGPDPQSQLAKLGHQIPALHTVQVLDRAYRSVPLI